MKKLLQVLVIFVTAMGAEDACALDAPPPPDHKTLQWTLELANKEIPILTTSETPVWSLLASFSSTMEMPGFYLDVDYSEVEERTKTKVTIEIRDTTWLAAIGQVADMIDADIQISPGVVKLVPRAANPAKPTATEGEQGVGLKGLQP